jgi:hypothetical protein
MPATSKKQYALMQAVKHDPNFAKKSGISKSVANEFVAETSPKFKKIKKIVGAK